jgi:hypothetical protein
MLPSAMKTRNPIRRRGLNDLFQLFPELPRFPKQSIDRRRHVAEIKGRIAEVRRQATRAVEQRKAMAERVRKYWEMYRTKRKG